MAHRRGNRGPRARHPYNPHPSLPDRPWKDNPPLFTSRPSVSMEKTLAEERKRAWQSTPSDVRRPNFWTTCVEATCCPCVLFARTSTRLEHALSGRDATNLGFIPFFNTDCFTFCLCLPFYGCFISKVQQTVRAFYDIDGSNREDLTDGCFCPCCTLCRNDEEIYRRELQEKKLNELRASFLNEQAANDPKNRKPPFSYGEYKPHKPMVHTLQECNPLTTSPPRAKSAAFGGKDLDDDLAGLEAIPELSQEASVIASGTAGTEGPPAPASPDPATKTNKYLAELSKRNIMQHLGRFWHNQNADKKENEKPTTGDETEKSAAADKPHSLNDHDGYASQAVSRHAAHGLEEHSKVAADANKSRFKEHFLKEDKPAARPAALGSPHILASDPVLSRVNVSTPHRLERDTEASAPAAPATGHDLGVDSTTANVRSPAAHRLEIDPLESTRPNRLWPGSARHDLQADEKTDQPTLVPHPLREDITGDPTKRALSPHRLDSDKIHENDVSTSHALENDTNRSPK